MPTSRALPGLSQNDEKRFYSYVDKDSNSGCWIWKPARRYESKQYRTVSVMHLQGRTASAQRIAWFLHYDTDPVGYSLVRTCGNTACVNPKHFKAEREKE